MEEELRALNLAIAREETNGNKAFFDALLAPTFAFRRANGAFNDRQIFLAGLKPETPRECDPQSIGITPIGKTRALVTCIVAIETEKGRKEFHNTRLFVLDSKDWRLLAWANEELA